MNLRASAPKASAASLIETLTKTADTFEEQAATFKAYADRYPRSSFAHISPAPWCVLSEDDMHALTLEDGDYVAKRINTDLCGFSLFTKEEASALMFAARKRDHTNRWLAFPLSAVAGRCAKSYDETATRIRALLNNQGENQ